MRREGKISFGVYKRTEIGDRAEVKGEKRCSNIKLVYIKLCEGSKIWEFMNNVYKEVLLDERNVYTPGMESNRKNKYIFGNEWQRCMVA